MSDDEIFYFNINNIIDNGIVSTLYPVFTTNNRLDSKFLQYELNFGKEFRKYSVLQKQGGSRTYMYFNKLRDLKLTITTSLKEQECIRNLICSIDHLITLHQLEPFQLIFKAIAYRIIDYAKSKPPRCRKYTGFIAFINTMYKNCVYTQYNHLYSLKSYYIKDIILLIKSAYICKIII